MLYLFWQINKLKEAYHVSAIFQGRRLSDGDSLRPFRVDVALVQPTRSRDDGPGRDHYILDLIHGNDLDLGHDHDQGNNRKHNYNYEHDLDDDDDHKHDLNHDNNHDSTDDHDDQHH